MLPESLNTFDVEFFMVEWVNRPTLHATSEKALLRTSADEAWNMPDHDTEVAGISVRARFGDQTDGMLHHLPCYGGTISVPLLDGYLAGSSGFRILGFPVIQVSGYPDSRISG